ncbi:hypothetical protein HDU93_008276, partial [Gonapodya sp. JEL0774]
MPSPEDDDDPPMLSAAALAALTSFIQEKNEQEERFERLRKGAEERFAGVNAIGEEESKEPEDLGIADFEEDWQMSQFWYDDVTAEALAREAVAAAYITPVIPLKSFESTNPTEQAVSGAGSEAEGGGTRKIGVLCAPSVFVKLR